MSEKESTDAARASETEPLPEAAEQGLEAAEQGRDTPEREPETPSTFSTGRPVAVLMVFLAAVVFGLLSYDRLPITLMPELSYPTVTVRTEYTGAAPEEVENDISRPIEEALGVVGGLRRISSISRADLSDVVLEFSWDTRISDATQDILERLDQVFLPDGSERPLILHFDPALDPVLELSLAGQGDRFEGEEGLRRLRRLADLQIKRALEPIKGIAAVRIRGGLEEEIHVLIDDEKMARTGLSIDQVINRLSSENINVAGGTIKEGRTEYMVRTLNEYQNLEQIGETIIARPAGREVRIKDVATVRWAHKEREILTHTDGGESVQIDIFKEADANIVALAERVRNRLGDFEPDKADEESVVAESSRGRPGAGRGDGRGEEQPEVGLAEELYRSEGAFLSVVADRSLFIESSISEVRNTALFGGLLAIIVLALFLRNAWSTFIIGVSIPISLLITFAPLNLLGVSLNIMSLGGLALGVGMLVDSSIVVLESIFRCREEGENVIRAAIRGTSEVRGAVVASTLTSIAVFFPMVFVEGIAGEAFGDLGMAVVISLLASLLVAVMFIPMLASREVNLDGGAAARRARGFASFRATRKDFSALGAWLARPGFPGRLIRLLLALPTALFFAARLPLSLAFESLGMLFLLVVRIVAVIVRRVVWPVLARVVALVLLPLLKLTDGVLGVLQRVYPPVLRWAVSHGGVIVLVMAGVIGASFLLARDLGSELLPEVHQGEFTFEVSLPVGTPLDETDQILAPVERAILSEREHIASMIVTYGFDSENAKSADEGEHSARFKVLLEREERSPGEKLAALFGAGGEDMKSREEKVIERLRRRLREIPDLDSRVVRPVLFSSRTPIEVEVHGDDLGRLREMGEEVAAVMAQMPELADVELSLKSGAPEVQIIYNRELLSRYDLNLRQTAELVRNQVKGFEATRFNLKDRRVPVMVRLAERDREAVDDVRALTVNPGGERAIPLESVADVILGEGPSEVRRIDGRRVALVGANLGDASLGAAVTSIRSRLSERIDWPANMAFYISGQNEEWQRSQGSLYLALALSIFLVYVIMAAQFESLVQPLVIMLTIPLAFFGTVIALSALEISLSVVVFLGMIMLAGIVVNNAIVLVDYINTLRGRGMSRDEAIVNAGKARLRPILMTTATTALGLLPMALGLGDGAEIRTPMAIAVISGLLMSTGLTLIIVPAIYALFDRTLSRLFGREMATSAVAEDGQAEDANGDYGTLPGVDPEALTT